MRKQTAQDKAEKLLRQNHYWLLKVPSMLVETLTQNKGSPCVNELLLLAQLSPAG